MDKEKKEKLQERINEVTEKVYDGVNIRGGLDNMYNVVDKIRTIALSILCIMIAIMTIISLYSIEMVITIQHYKHLEKNYSILSK